MSRHSRMNYRDIVLSKLMLFFEANNITYINHKFKTFIINNIEYKIINFNDNIGIYKFTDQNLLNIYTYLNIFGAKIYNIVIASDIVLCVELPYLKFDIKLECSEYKSFIDKMIEKNNKIKDFREFIEMYIKYKGNSGSTVYVLNDDKCYVAIEYGNNKIKFYDSIVRKFTYFNDFDEMYNYLYLHYNGYCNPRNVDIKIALKD